MNLKQFKSRELYVSISTNDLAKRQANPVKKSMPRSTVSPSPGTPKTNGEMDYAASTSSFIKDELKPSKPNIQARTIALLNVPDTVNDARIRALAENYGAIVKVTLRPDHQGAIIEYRDIAAAGKAALGIDGLEITPGRKLGVGNVKEMLQQPEEKKTDKLYANGSKKKDSATITLQSGAPIRRPTHPTARRGGKLGLGARREGRSQPAKGAEINGMTDEKAKSNDDFRAIFLNSSFRSIHLRTP